MSKVFTALGFMSCTSGDGVDASIIKSNGEIRQNNQNLYNPIYNEYFSYDNKLFNQIHNLKKKIHNLSDIQKNEREIVNTERTITLFHATLANTILSKHDVDMICFHGHTIYHNPEQKTTIQLGNGKLLSQATKKNVVYNFRSEDILNGGQGAPLTPLFHRALFQFKNISPPWIVLNIGGISNITWCDSKLNFFAKDIGPGNCLIDEWIRENTKFRIDKNGDFALAGKTDKIILEQALDREMRYSNKKRSLDTNDYDLGFVRGLALEDGAATLTEYTAEIISSNISSLFNNVNEKIEDTKLILSGGGRKNTYLKKKIINKTKMNVKLIDDYNIEGDFVESQAFAFLGIRSFNKLPISYPWMTGCKKNFCNGGEIVKIK